MKKQGLLLLLITLIAFGIRFYQLDSLPSILNRDEAAIAYNAYLLSETGKDEWSRAWPITLESFGDYKLPGYPFVLAIIFKFFGEESDLLVRLPSALAGTALVVIAYWLALKLAFKKLFALLFSWLIAISPVFWFYSRIAFEANLSLAFFIPFLVLLLFSDRKLSYSSRYAKLLLSFVLLIASAFTYNTPFVLLPFLILLVPLSSDVKKYSTWLPMIIALSVIWFVLAYVFVPLTVQKSGITIFSDETIWQESVNYRQQFSGVASEVLGSKYVFWTSIILKNVVNSFSPKFLVTQGGNHPWHSLPDWGNIYWLVYIMGLVGILSSIWDQLKMFKIKIMPFSNDLVLLILLGVSLVPSVITVDAPHTTRSLLFLFLFVLFATKGLYQVATIIKERLNLKSEKIFWILTLFILLINSIYYGYFYFYLFPNNQPGGLQAGFQEKIIKVNEIADQPVAVVDGGGYWYILTAWYLKLPPTVFFKSIVRQQPDKIGFKYGQQVANYHFIVNRDDRQENEKTVLEWQGRNWTIEEF